MTNGGDAAEQIVRLSLEGFEVAAKLTGSAAKNVAILLASVLKQEVSQSNKTRGKARLTNMIKSGKELKVFSLPQKDLQKFTEQAKKYGVPALCIFPCFCPYEPKQGKLFIKCQVAFSVGNKPSASSSEIHSLHKPVLCARKYLNHGHRVCWLI